MCERRCGGGGYTLVECSSIGGGGDGVDVVGESPIGRGDRVYDWMSRLGGNGVGEHGSVHERVCKYTSDSLVSVEGVSVVCCSSCSRVSSINRSCKRRLFPKFATR